MTKTRFAIVLWRNYVSFRSNTHNASPLRKVHVKRYWFVPAVMLFPVKTWAIVNFARRTSKRFWGWYRIQIHCLMRVKSPFFGSVRTERLHMSPLSSDTGIPLKIKPSRHIVALKFLALVHPRSVCGDFYFAWHDMMPYYAS